MKRRKPTYLELEVSRNRRLWFQKVIVPMTLAAAMVLKDRRNRKDFAEFTKKTYEKAESKVKKIFSK